MTDNKEGYERFLVVLAEMGITKEQIEEEELGVFEIGGVTARYDLDGVTYIVSHFFGKPYNAGASEEHRFLGGDLMEDGELDRILQNEGFADFLLTWCEDQHCTRALVSKIAEDAGEMTEQQGEEWDVTLIGFTEAEKDLLVSDHVFMEFLIWRAKHRGMDKIVFSKKDAIDLAVAAGPRLFKQSNES